MPKLGLAGPHCRDGRCALGWLILDKDDPTVVVARADDALLFAELPFETVGYVAFFVLVYSHHYCTGLGPHLVLNASRSLRSATTLSFPLHHMLIAAALCGLCPQSDRRSAAFPTQTPWVVFTDGLQKVAEDEFIVWYVLIRGPGTTLFHSI